jgi:hypothetical protein
MTREAFEAIHQFLNTACVSRLGKGLDLPIADSMFMYCERPGGLSFFRGLSDVAGEDSGFLADAVKNGWIDSLHAYGDFLSPDVFSRKMAERALNELERNNIRLKVWIDHGSADNTQNFAFPNLVSKGDNRKHIAYHTDLLKQYGVLFTGGYSSEQVGQNGKKRYLTKPLPQADVPLSFFKRLHGRFCGRRLLHRRRCKDNNVFYAFCRARNGVLRPDASTLSHQLSAENVQKLIKSEGTMILYQHLGSINKRANEFPYLDLQARKVLSNIADKYREGTVWVAPTSKILAFSYVMENIKLSGSNNNDRLVIKIMNKNESPGQMRLADLKDVSFRVDDYRGEKIILRFEDYTLTRSEYETFEDPGLIIKLRPCAQN